MGRGTCADGSQSRPVSVLHERDKRFPDWKIRGSLVSGYSKDRVHFTYGQRPTYLRFVPPKNPVTVDSTSPGPRVEKQ